MVASMTCRHATTPSTSACRSGCSLAKFDLERLEARASISNRARDDRQHGDSSLGTAHEQQQWRKVAQIEEDSRRAAE